MFVMGLRDTEAEAREAIAASLSFTETLRRLGMCWSGGNYRTLRKWASAWGISTDHVDPDAARRRVLRRSPLPLDEVLVKGSTYSRGKLKERLYETRRKQRECELCGQGELWRGRRTALILDHISGDPLDNRLTNLRIVCPNCAATLDTHCGRKHARSPEPRECRRCGKPFVLKHSRQTYCSRECGQRWERTGRPIPGARRAVRPPYEQLLADVAATNWSAVGRKYGVSGNAIRKWVRDYERERAASVEADGAAGGGVPGPVGPAGSEVDAAEPAVHRRASGGAREDGLSIRRELVAAVREGDERGQVRGERVDRGVTQPRPILVLRYRGEELMRSDRASAEGVENLAFDAGEAGADVRKLLQEAFEAGDAEPRAGVG
jgi:transposase-like protein